MKPFENFEVTILQGALDYHSAKIRETQAVINTIREGLKGRCDHTNAEEYKWEHDNGYGRQTMITGKRCVHCLFVDLWNNGHFVDPNEL